MKQPSLFALLLTCLLAGCALTQESPPTHFYILPAPEAANFPTRSLKQVIGVRPIVLPSYLDRPQIVTMTKGGEVRLADFHHWAEPPSAGIERVLTAGLTARLPNSRIVPSPVHHLHPDRLLQIKVHEFQAGESECRLLAEWRLSRNNRTLAWRREDIRLPLPSSSYDDIVQTMGRAIDVLAARIVEKLPAD